MRMRWLLVGVATAGVLVAGCSTVVDGSGSTGSSAAGGGPTDFPSPSGAVVTTAEPSSASSPAPLPSSSSGVAGVTGCPHAAHPAAKLSYYCFASFGTPQTGSVWPLTFALKVESTGWVMEEGSGHWGPADGQSLATITKTVRTRMVSSNDYLPDPKVTTVADRDISLDGTTSHLLQSTITLDPAQAEKRGTKVREEHLWIVAVPVAGEDVSLWYASVPDIAKQYWTRVPAAIQTINVQR